MRGRFVSIRKMYAAIGIALTCALMLEARALNTWAQRLTVGEARDAALKATQLLLVFTEHIGLDHPRAWMLRERESLTRRLFPAALHTEDPASEPRSALAVAPDSPSAQATRSDPASSEPSVAPATPVVTSSDGETTSPRRPAAQPEQRRTIALVGDSMMAVGLAAALQRRIRSMDGTGVLRAYRSATGLIRPDVFDWMVQYPKLIGDVRPDVVICVIGANDAQNVQAGRDVLRFNTPAWNDHYGARVRSFAELLARDGASVLWVGMPVMREPGFSNRMMALNAIVRESVSGIPGTEWIDIGSTITDAQGRFLQYRKLDGQRTLRLRADDGIHLSDDGAEAIASAITAWIEPRLR